MMKPMIIGIWGCVATLAGAYGGVYWRTHANDTAKSAAHEEKLETRKIKPITVPIIGNGVIKGYILAEFSLVSPKGDPHDHALDPEGYFLDEAYRLIYGWLVDRGQIRNQALHGFQRPVLRNVHQLFRHLLTQLIELQQWIHGRRLRFDVVRLAAKAFT